MALLRAFHSAERLGLSDAETPEIVCYEKQDDWGGQWNYSWRTGTDHYGEPVHSSMYRNLWSNGPKEVLEFADYTFDDHFGRPISSYPPREVLWNYIDGRLKGTDLKSKVRFATAVRWVAYDEDTETFSVTVHDLKNNRTETNEFDYVVVSSGHFSFPNVPSFPGIESFPGPVLHAHNFRGAEGWAGRDVLMIGASYSAEDIGSQAYKMGAKSVTMSYRSKPMGYDWPEDMEEQPLIERIDGSTVTFINGVSKDFDVIVQCTGYLHHYPFLGSDLALNSSNNIYPDHLYRGVMLENNNRVFYIGAQDQWLTFNMFDAQAWFVRDVILGRITLPSATEQREHMDQWRERFLKADTADAEIDFQTDYVRDLIQQTDYPEFDLYRVADILKGWVQDKKRDIMGYRNAVYASVMTGTMAREHHTEWIHELDDSLVRYLGEPESDEARDIVKGGKGAERSRA